MLRIFIGSCQRYGQLKKNITVIITGAAKSIIKNFRGSLEITLKGFNILRSRKINHGRIISGKNKILNFVPNARAKKIAAARSHLHSYFFKLFQKAQIVAA